MRLFESMLLVAMALPLAGCLESNKSESFSATVGGTARGLSGTATLTLNGDETLTLSQNGSFQFTTRLRAGQPYSISVATQPANQSCSVVNGAGTLPYASISDVLVTCATNDFAIGGAVSGLSGSVELQNGSDVLTVLANGSFRFPNRAPTGASYAVVVRAQPAGAHCDVTSGSGTVGTQDIANVAVICRAVNAVNGTLSPLPGSPYAVGGSGPRTLAITPDSKFVYTITQSSNTVVIFSINAATGALTPVGSPMATGGQPLYNVITPNGKFLYVASFNNRSVYGYAINATTGTLTPVAGSPFAVYDLSTYARSLTLDPRGKFLFVPTYTTSVSAFAIDPDTGTLAMVAGSPFATGGTQASFATVEPSGRFLYLTNQNSNNISAYSIDGISGVLTPLPGSPFANGHSPQEIKADSGGKYLYVANESSREVNVYTIDATTGSITLVPGAPFSTSTIAPGGIAILAQ